LKTTVGGNLSELIAHTHSVQYAETTAVQAGYQRSGDPVVTGGTTTAIRPFVWHQEQNNPKCVADNDRILAKYGFTRDTAMLWHFDIDFPVRPIQ